MNDFSPPGAILYLNIPTPGLSIELAQRPKLRQWPLVLAPGQTSRSLIWEVSPQARLWGVEKGRPLAEAVRRCPDLKVLSPRLELYRKVHRKLVEDVVGQMTSCYESEKLGHLFLDMRQHHFLHKNAAAMAHKLRSQTLQSTGLESSVGAAVNKLVSKVAAKSGLGHRGIEVVNGGEEASFLSPLPVEVLPIVKKIRKSLAPGADDVFCDLNLRTVGDVAQLDSRWLQVAFGRWAQQVKQMSLGLDSSPVLAEQGPAGASIIAESYLQRECNQRELLQGALLSLVEQVCSKLRAKKVIPQKIFLRLRYNDFRLSQAQMSGRKMGPQLAPLSEKLFPLFEQLFERLWTRRSCLRFIGVECGELVPYRQQLSFWDQMDTEKGQQVAQVRDQVVGRFGAKGLCRGSELLAKSNELIL